MYQISYEKFLDKVHGGWYGKCLGGAAGAPVEGVKKLIPVDDFTEIFNPDLPNDAALSIVSAAQQGIDCIADRHIGRSYEQAGYRNEDHRRQHNNDHNGIASILFFQFCDMIHSVT